MDVLQENRKLAEEVIDLTLGILARRYPVRKLDSGRFAEVTAMNMTFQTAHYEIEGAGHLMTMYVKDNPQMSMATCTFTPCGKKLPLVSADFIFQGEGGMFLIEIYELVKDREAPAFREWMSRFDERFRDLSELEDIPTRPCFYDPIRPIYVCKKRNMDLDRKSIRNLADTLRILMDKAQAGETLTGEEAEEQRAIQREYVDNLIDMNGVSTEVFVKEHGKDFVREFFHDVFFNV